MKINFVSKTIEVSKTYAAKASHFGSMEYMELRTATNELPDFSVVVKTTPAPRQTCMKGLTYEYMEAYIATVDEDGSIMKEFQCLRHGSNYATVKKWFMTLLSEDNNFAA